MKKELQREVTKRLNLNSNICDSFIIFNTVRKKFPVRSEFYKRIKMTKERKKGT